MLIQYILIIVPPPKKLYCFCVIILLFLSHNKLYPNDQISCFVIYACIYLFSTMIHTDHNKDEDNNDADGNVTEHPRILGREQAPPKRFEDYEKYMLLLKKRTSSCCLWERAQENSMIILEWSSTSHQRMKCRSTWIYTYLQDY